MHSGTVRSTWKIRHHRFPFYRFQSSFLLSLLSSLLDQRFFFEKNFLSVPWGAALRFLWDTGSDLFRPKSVPSSPMMKRAFSRLGTITAGWGRSIKKHGSGNTLQSEDRKRWASSQDCSSTYIIDSVRRLNIVLRLWFYTFGKTSCKKDTVNGKRNWRSCKSYYQVLNFMHISRD